MGQLVRLGLRRSEYEGRRREDQELVPFTPVASQSAFDIRVEGFARLKRAVPTEDRVRGRGRELSPLVRIAGLEDDRSPLWAAGHIELPGNIEMVAVVLERAGTSTSEEHS